MITVKLYEDDPGVYANVDDAVDYMKRNNFENEITVYDINTHRALEKTTRIYQAIKEYNEGKPLDDQILPGYPYEFRGIVGCLGVQCYSISLGTYRENHECIALFTGYNDSVLDTSNENACIIPGTKALSSLALFGRFASTLKGV